MAESARREAPESGSERRRYHRLTALGQQVLAAECRGLDALLRSPAVRTIVHGLPGWAT